MKRSDTEKIIGETLHESYRIERLIGQGGMGAVFEATHLRLKHRFAVKLLFEAEQRDPELQERFRREAEITAVLRHPHIVEVTDYNYSQRWGAYLVLELLDGESLHARVERDGPLPVERISAILSQAAAALEISHQHGIVHRDLKPSNIFLCRVDGSDDFVKLLDFGIARVIGGMSLVTRDGSRLGTSTYMSPEQVSGPDVDWSSDLFSMGSIVYYMLAGRPPFLADSDSAVFYQIETRDPPPLAKLVPALPEAAAGAVGRALAKQPADRFGSLEEFARCFAEAADSSRAATRDDRDDEPRGAKGRRSDHEVRPAARATPGRRGLALAAVVAGVIGAAVWGRGLLCATTATLPDARPRDALVDAARGVGARAAPDATPDSAARIDLARPADGGARRLATPLVQPPGPRPRPPPAGSRRLGEQCRAGAPRACVTLGKRFERRKDTALAIAAYLRACNLDSARGCYNLGKVYEHTRDYNAAMVNETRACEMKLGPACAQLGELYLSGKGGSKNVVRARKYFARACALRAAAGCASLGRMYCAGGDLPTNLAECRGLLGKACRYGDRRACAQVRKLGRRTAP